MERERDVELQILILPLLCGLKEGSAELPHTQGV